MKLAVHQPMAKWILHTKFHQNRTMGLRSAPALYIMESKGSDPVNVISGGAICVIGYCNIGITINVARMTQNCKLLRNFCMMKNL